MKKHTEAIIGMLALQHVRTYMYLLPFLVTLLSCPLALLSLSSLRNSRAFWEQETSNFGARFLGLPVAKTGPSNLGKYGAAILFLNCLACYGLVKIYASFRTPYSAEQEAGDVL